MAAIWPAFASPRAALASPIWARAPNIAFSRRVRSRPGNGSSARHQLRIRKRIPSLPSRGSVDGRADLQTSAIAGQCALPDADKSQSLSRSPGGFRPVHTAILHKHSFFCPAVTSDGDLPVQPDDLRVHGSSCASLFSGSTHGPLLHSKHSAVARPANTGPETGSL